MYSIFSNLVATKNPSSVETVLILSFGFILRLLSRPNSLALLACQDTNCLPSAFLTVYHCYTTLSVSGTSQHSFVRINNNHVTVLQDSRENSFAVGAQAYQRREMLLICVLIPHERRDLYKCIINPCVEGLPSQDIFGAQGHCQSHKTHHEPCNSINCTF